jgi:hypothetical protein
MGTHSQEEDTHTSYHSELLISIYLTHYFPLAVPLRDSCLLPFCLKICTHNANDTDTTTLPLNALSPSSFSAPSRFFGSSSVICLSSRVLVVFFSKRKGTTRHDRGTWSSLFGWLVLVRCVCLCISTQHLHTSTHPQKHSTQSTSKSNSLSPSETLHFCLTCTETIPSH